MGSQNPAWYFTFLKGKKEEEIEEDGGDGGSSEHHESGFRSGHHGNTCNSDDVSRA